MRKEVSFLIVAAIIALGIVLIYYWGGQPTGFVTKLEQFENEADCVGADADYVWYKENCYDAQPICSLDFLELCEDEINCTGVEGHWYILEGNEDPTCNEAEEPSCSNDLSLCLDETNCTDPEIGGGHWYIIEGNEDPTCNEYECEIDSHCDEEYVCIDGSCEILGCTNQYAMNYNPDATQDDGSCYECKKDADCGEGYVCVSGYCETPENLTQEVPILEEIPVLMPSLDADEIQNFKLNPGDSAEISWNVRNNGGIFLSSCFFEVSGEYADLISYEGEEFTSIGIGSSSNFDFSISVPEEEVEEGSHPLTVAVKCAQTTVSRQFILEIEIKKLEFDLIAADRTRLDRVRIIYSLSELMGEAQDIELRFVLLGAEAEEIAFIEENQSLKANDVKEFKTNMQINESLEGELELVISYNSEIYSSSVREPIVLGAPIGGAAIFEGIGAGEIAIVVIVIIALVVILFIVKKIKSSGKTLRTLFQRKKEN